MSVSFAIAGRPIGPDHPTYIVAELSANHGGSIETALATIEQAKACGADAVKLQTYTADTITLDDDGADFRIEGGPWHGRRLYELYDEAHTPWDWHEALFTKARVLGITIFSTPFDESAVDLLEALDAPAYKIASFELLHLPLIRRVAQTGKPVVISTGMASSEEISEAVDVFRAAGGRELLLLHCISGYPTPPEQSNLRRIPILAERFDVPVGLSDHTLGIAAAVTAVALGACFIEKHFTLRRAAGGPDSAFSLEPDEFKALTSGAKAAFLALGTGEEGRSQVEEGNKMFRRSIYVVRDMLPGETFTAENVRIIRPGFGLAPKELPSVIGRKAACAIGRGSRLSWDLVV